MSIVEVLPDVVFDGYGPRLPWITPYRVDGSWSISYKICSLSGLRIHEGIAVPLVAHLAGCSQYWRSAPISSCISVRTRRLSTLIIVDNCCPVVIAFWTSLISASSLECFSAICSVIWTVSTAIVSSVFVIVLLTYPSVLVACYNSYKVIAWSAAIDEMT